MCVCVCVRSLFFPILLRFFIVVAVVVGVFVVRRSSYVAILSLNFIFRAIDELHIRRRE